ncbi:hypothetical protein ONZ45_g1231 [Pleurotus djamor]|nr:hypothetical protein ONZ45_g1231 [Pleurotus djamor]
MSNAEPAYIVDDTDPRVKYSSGWHRDGGPNEYNTSVHATSTAGASFTFKFNGTSVKVLGTLTQEGFAGSFPNTSYVLDGTTPISFAGKPSPRVQYSQLFYQSPVDLPDTEHTLIGTCVDQGSLVWIDFFVVTSPSASLTQTTPTLSESYVVVTTTVAVSQAALESSSSSNDFPVGAVVGSVLGGIFLVLIAMSLILWYRRRPVSTTTTEMAMPPPSFTSSQLGSTASLLGRPPISVNLPPPPTSASSMYSSPSPIELPSLGSPSTISMASMPSTVPSGASRKMRTMQPLHVPVSRHSVNYSGSSLERGDYPPAYGTAS